MPDQSLRSGPLVLNIRLSGRLVPFSATLMLFALLPFLGGSAPQTPNTSVVLAAGDRALVEDAVAAIDSARNDLADTAIAGVAGSGGVADGATAATGSAFSAALGGGLFMFPAIELTPLAAEAIAAPIVGRPTFIHPVAGGETSAFGPRIHPVLGRPMFHTGIDLAATCGTPIRAAASGTVIYARVSASWGLRTIIEHTSSLKSAYGHQSKFFVKEGDVVKQGQVIGLVGTTGWSTGCHLHFDVIVNNRYVDPAPYLGFAPSDAKSVPYAVVPHLVLDKGGRIVHTVEDGDVPLPEATPAPSRPSTTPTTGTPSTRPTGTTSPTSEPTTTTPTTTKPTTSTPSTTTSPTGTTGSPTTTTNPPTTTSEPPTSTTSDPPTTSEPPATSDPPPATTSDPPPETTTAAEPSPSETTSDSSGSDSTTSSDPTATETATATATEVLATADEVATSSAPAETTSEPAPESTTAAEGGS